MAIKVLDGRRHFGVSLAERVRGGNVQALAARAGVTIPPFTEVAEGATVQAHLNHNRWIADCPVCGGAEYVWPDEPYFMCLSCFNGAQGHRWLKVVFPARSFMAKAEAVMLARPNPQARNWRPGETLTKLRAENREHGLPEEV